MFPASRTGGNEEVGQADGPVSPRGSESVCRAPSLHQREDSLWWKV